MRPAKKVLDRFYHHITPSPSTVEMEIKYGLEGYGFVYKIYEMLAGSEDHVLDLNNPSTYTTLLTVMKMSSVSVNKRLAYMAESKGIDQGLWDLKLVWSKDFIELVSPLYKRRGAPPAPKAEVKRRYASKRTVVDIDNEIKTEDRNIELQSKISGKKKPKKNARNVSKEAKQVIEYLNLKLNKVRPFTDISQISARLRSGATIEDCKTVIDNKMQDPYFIENPRYMNPVTLFRKTHWDVYLTQTPDVLNAGGENSAKMATNIRSVSTLKDRKSELDKVINEKRFEMNKTPGKVAREKAEKDLALLETQREDVVESIKIMEAKLK